MWGCAGVAERARGTASRGSTPSPQPPRPPGGITVLGGWPVRKEAPLPVCLLFLQCNWDVEGADGGLDHNRSHGCSGVAVMRGRGSVGSAFFARHHLESFIYKSFNFVTVP